MSTAENVEQIRARIARAAEKAAGGLRRFSWLRYLKRWKRSAFCRRLPAGLRTLGKIAGQEIARQGAARARRALASDRHAAKQQNQVCCGEDRADPLC